MRTSPDKQCSVTPANTEETCHSHWDFSAAPQKAEHRALLLYLGFVLFRDKSTLNTNGRNQTMQFFTLAAKRMFKKKKKTVKTIFHFFNIPLLWSTTISPLKFTTSKTHPSFQVWEHKFKMKTSHECNCAPDAKTGTESKSKHTRCTCHLSFPEKEWYDALKSIMFLAAQHLFVWLERLSRTVFTHSQ